MKERGDNPMWALEIRIPGKNRYAGYNFLMNARRDGSIIIRSDEIKHTIIPHGIMQEKTGTILHLESTNNAWTRKICLIGFYHFSKITDGEMEISRKGYYYNALVGKQDQTEGTF